jgi:allophanate hydrolase subunit 2
MSEDVKVSIWDQYGTDTQLEEDGTAVEFLPGVVITIRADSSQKVREHENGQMRRQRALIARNGGFLPPAVVDSNEIDLLAKAGVVAWQGVTDRDGGELPCTEENIRSVMTALPHLRRDVRSAMRMSETFRRQAVEEVRGNSSAPSKKSSA